MQKFTTLTGVAAPLPMINVDTDKIIPKQYLKTIERTGLGKALFDELRYNADGSEKPDFVLNQPAYRKAEILVAGENFGCGSSREHAPWALLDFGIRAVIAPSFADIFANNCVSNGILTVQLGEPEVAELMRRAQETPGYQCTVDLVEKKVTDGRFSAPFQIDDFRRRCLMEGLDSIQLTLQHEAQIAAYESRHAGRQ